MHDCALYKVCSISLLSDVPLPLAILQDSEISEIRLFFYLVN